ILDATPLCMNLWDINLNNVMCNKEAVRLFDLENEQEYTKRFFELSPEYQPDGSLSSERAAVYIHQAFNGGWAQFNWMHCNLKGDLIPAEITLVKIEGLDDDGEDMVAGFTRDLRPQLVAQSAEKKAAQRINAALNSMPLTCLIFSPELELIDCNEVALKLFGVSDKEELGEHFDDFMPEYQPTGSLSLVKKNEVFQQTLETGRSFIEWMYINKNGEEIPSEVTLVKLKEDDGEIVLAYSRDLRELHQTLEMNTRLTRIAYFDPLTGSASRAKFMEHLAESFNAYSCGHKIKNFSLFILDFDNFKGVNDTYGHDAGDVTLRTIIRKIDAMLPVEGIIGRYGGDEFVIQLTDLTPNQVSELMNRCVKEIAQLTIESEEHHFKTSISIGGTFCQPDDPNIDTLIKRADIALYKAKSLGRNCFVLD
ncbi:MAG: GGDEF domain-containing protein, partial [Eubacterium sp.]